MAGQTGRPDGLNLFCHPSSIIQTCLAGSIIFYYKFSLLDILNIPEFSYNLISVLELNHALACNMIFDKSKCTI
jgi:hypothetical protein